MDTAEFKEFKDTILAYVQLSDELGLATKAMRGLRKRKSDLGKSIVGYMAQNNLDACQLPEGGGKLERRESKRQESLKRDHISAELSSLQLPPAKHEEILEAIDASREVVVSTKLKHIKAQPAAIDD